MLKNNPINDPVERYARDVLDNRIVAGRLVKLACQRHLDDRKHGHKRGLICDPAEIRAKRVPRPLPSRHVAPHAVVHRAESKCIPPQ